MRIATLAKVLLPLWLTAGLVVANCTGSNMGGGGVAVEEGEPVGPACDPDGEAPCPDDWFICTENGVGGKTCEGQNPATPDDAGAWACVDDGDTLVCTGDHLPSDDSGDWACVDNGDGSFTCTTDSYVPNTGDGGSWECWYEGTSRVCEYTPGGDDGGDSDTDGDVDDTGGDHCPPGIEIPSDEICDGRDNDCDGVVDEDCPEGGEPPPDCACIPGAWRYCDTPTYCRWGVQHCADDGLEWGACNEITSIPAACAGIDGWYSPAAEACCVAEGLCCQDMWDIDRDGDTWESLGDCTDIVCE